MLVQIPARLDEDGRPVFSLGTIEGSTKTATFHCTVDGHNKWWRFTWDRDTLRLLTEWGPLGSAVTQDNVKEWQSWTDVEALVTSKLRKGYREVREEPEDTSMDWGAALDAEREEAYEVEDLVEWLSQVPNNTFAESLVEFYDNKGFLTPSQLAAARRMRATETDPVTAEGLYQTPEGTVFKVQRAKKGHLYALVEVDGEWELARGAMRNLRGSMKVSGLL